VATLELSLSRGETSLDGRAVPCPPLSLLRAFAEAALEFCALTRARNPRQAENAHLGDLEASASERIAELDELAGGDLVLDLGGQARGPAGLRLVREPLGPGRLRRLSFRRVFAAELGMPVSLSLRDGRLLAAGRGAVLLLDVRTGAEKWRAGGAGLAVAFPGGVLAARADRLRFLSPSTGRPRWERVAPGGPPTGAALMAGGPLVLAEPGAVTGLDVRTGETAWRFTAPGASRTWVVCFGRLSVAGSDTGFLHGLDAEGRLIWRVRAPGLLLRAPTAWGGLCLALCETAPGSALLALDAATGVRRFEAPLELTPSGAPVPWGRRLAIPGTVGGDPAVTVLDRSGAPAFTTAPPLTGAPALLPAGPLLVLRGAAGGLTALGRDGAPRWTRPAGPAGGSPGGLALSRETVVTAGEGLCCHALETGELVGALPATSAALLAVDRELTVAALDVDGLLTVHRLGTHLSLV
jgi:outer membrane protein assembly factor BamB